MRTRTLMNVLVMILTVSVTLWYPLASQAKFVFDKVPIPAGTHLIGPSVKGTMTWNVTYNNGTVIDAKITLEGKCGNKAINTVGTPLVWTSFTDPAFRGLDGDAVAADVEGVYLDGLGFETELGAFIACWGESFRGVFVTAVTKTIEKTTNKWKGEVVLQGVVN